MTKPKTPPDPRVKQFIDFAFVTYREKCGIKLIITGADTKLTKLILGTFELEELEQYWLFFLYYTGKDWMLAGATRDVKTFCGYINRIAQGCLTDTSRRCTPVPPAYDEDLRLRYQAEVSFNALSPEERESRIGIIIAHLKGDPRIKDKGWDPETYRSSAEAKLKEELEEGI